MIAENHESTPVGISGLRLALDYNCFAIRATQVHEFLKQHISTETVREKQFKLTRVIFSLRHRVQIGSEAHPASYPIGTRGSYPGGKATVP